MSQSYGQAPPRMGKFAAGKKQPGPKVSAPAPRQRPGRGKQFKVRAPRGTGLINQ